MEELPSSFTAELKDLLKSFGGKGESVEIKAIHKGASFDFYGEESAGTQRLFNLIGLWIKSLKNGKILVVDELDIRLHHRLNHLLIKLFHDPTQNQSNAQLVFSTHNVGLLDQTLFRRDQIWFTEKDEASGKTELFSLLEFKPRKDKDIKNGYLAGRYGAIPFVGENRIFHDD